MEQTSLAKHSKMLVVVEENKKDNSDNFGRIKALTQEILEVQDAHKNLQQGLETVDSVYRAHHGDLISQISDLMGRLNLLNQAYAEDIITKMKGDDTPISKKGVEQKTKELEKNVRRRVKLIYRRINNLCHPDRINKAKFSSVIGRLTSLLHAAQDAYRDDDLLTINQIFDQVLVVRGEVETYRKAKLDEDPIIDYKAEIDRLEKQLANVTSSLHISANSILYQVLEHHIKRQCVVASNIYRGMLIQRINSLEAQITTLTQKPSI